MEKNKIILGEPIGKQHLLINGKSELRDVYNVNIKSLYYNNQNGRIATYIAGYNSEHNTPLDELSLDEYNDKIMGFIKMSGSPDKFKKTINSIKSVGQQITGIILEDGRVIDGNRRFTCLRELYNETANEQYLYFKCFVLPCPKNKEEWATIKRLELNYQFGEDQREDYNPVDKLADIYHYLVNKDTRLFTAKEYAASTNGQITESKIKFMMVKASILYEYLSFINKEGRFDYARDMKLDGPIDELAKVKNKKKMSDMEWAKVSPVFFTKMQHMTGDRSREIRNLIKIYENDPITFEKISNQLFAVAIQEEEINNGVITGAASKTTSINIVNTLQNVENQIKSATIDINLASAREKQHKELEEVRKKLSNIDKTSILLSNNDEKNILQKDIELIEKEIKKIKEVINNVN